MTRMYIKPHTLLALVLLLVLTLLVSQSNAHNPSQTTKECTDAGAQPTHTEESTYNSRTPGPADWEAIGRTLGCVFAPGSCN